MTGECEIPQSPTEEGAAAPQSGVPSGPSVNGETNGNEGQPDQE
ncbi:MAG: hypothetical protein ACRD8W_10560 [Nitrososphaeraceae archaeon]